MRGKLSVFMMAAGVLKKMKNDICLCFSPLALFSSFYIKIKRFKL